MYTGCSVKSNVHMVQFSVYGNSVAVVTGNS